MCAQLFRRMMQLIAVCVTPCAVANSTWFASRAWYERRISSTLSAVSFAVFVRSPRGIRSLNLRLGFSSPNFATHGAGPRRWRCRPFAIMSATFCACVPAQRCFGLTHRRLSQLWHTLRPPGIAPTKVENDHRCANWNPPLKKLAYPLGVSFPVHSQHCVSGFSS